MYFAVGSAVVTCGVQPTINIPMCNLKGLTFDLLQFKDAACSVSDVVTQTESGYVVAVNPSLCGAEVLVSSGVGK